jgi:hypothetical protein
MVIVDAEAASDAVPYPGYCDTIGPAYKQLIGLSLLKHFRLHLKDRLSGVLGCTHLTELAQVLPTAAIQAFADDEMANRAAKTRPNVRMNSTAATRCAPTAPPSPGITRAGRQGRVGVVSRFTMFIFFNRISKSVTEEGKPA